MALTKVTSALTNLDGGITIDNITIDGTEIDLSSGDLTIDVAGDIILDAAGDNWLFNKSGTTLLNIQKDGDNVEFISSISDGDIKFRGNDGGSTITALTLDMSDAGKAFFNAGIAANDTSFITHVHSNHTNGLFIINSQAGGFGSALTFQSERSDNNVIVTAARIRTEGAEAWNADDAVSSVLIFESVQDNSLNERMRFTSGGNLLFATTSSPATAGGEGAVLESVSNGARLNIARSANAILIGFYNQNGEVGNISTSGSATAYNTSSDARLKDITGEARGLEVINQLNPVAYNWKADGKSDEGLIAQEVMNIVPNAVSQNEDDKYYQMDYSKLVTPLIKAIQEQQEQIDALQSEINILKGE